MTNFLYLGSRSDDSVAACPKGKGAREIAPFFNALQETHKPEENAEA